MPVDPADVFGGVLADAAPDTFAVGRVTALDGARVVVDVRGGSKTLPRLAAYAAPAAGHVVLIACVPGAWVVVGPFAT